MRLQLQELELIRRNLEHTVAVFKRCLFGSRSEKIDPKELEAGGEKAANLFSLMITSKRLKVEPYAYPHDVLRRLPVIRRTRISGN